jgi:UDP-glucose 4-epimerase
LTIKALKSSESRKIYNISDGHAYTQYDLANTIKKIMGRKTIKVHLPVPVVRVIAGVMESVGRNKTPALNVEKIKELTAENWSVNIEKAMHDLGYLPRYNLEAGIEETLEWYKQNNWL